MSVEDIAGCQVQGMSFAITGGSGYLGSRLATTLSKSNQVKIVDLHMPDIGSTHKCEYVKCDI